MKLQTLERLRLHLLSLGGDPDQGFGGIQRHSIVVDEWEEETALRFLMQRPLEPAHVELRPMERSDCHRNAERLALDLGPSARHYWGFALSGGIWRSHSWVVDGHGGIVETTEPRDLYVGVPGGHGYHVLRFLHGPGSIHHGKFGYRMACDDAAELGAEAVAWAPSPEVASLLCGEMEADRWNPHGTPCVFDKMEKPPACLTCGSTDPAACYLPLLEDSGPANIAENRGRAPLPDGATLETLGGGARGSR